jgi:hypothetical protein
MLTFKNLQDVRNRLAGGIAAESVHGQPGAVCDETPQRDLLLDGVLVFRVFPGRESSVDVLVQIQRTGLYELQSGCCCERLADGCRLEEGFRRHRAASLRIADTIAFGPDHLEVVDDSDADPRHPVVSHPFLECPYRTVLGPSLRNQAVLNPLNPSGLVV